MPDSNFACPHCRGTIRIDPSMAGQAVMCPLCQGTLRVPEVVESSDHFPVQEPGQHRSFACPLCQSPFLVTAEWLGQPVQCPSCQGTVNLPTSEMLDEMASGIAPSPTDAFPTAPSPTAPSPTDAFPTRPNITTDDATSQKEFESTDPVGRSPIEKPVVTPPAAKPPDRPASPRISIEKLLPPRFSRPLPGPGAHQQASVEIDTSSPSPAPLLPPVQTSSTVTVTIDGEEYHLRRLTPEELQSRRRTRNIVMFLAGAIFLVLVAAILMQR